VLIHGGIRAGMNKDDPLPSQVPFHLNWLIIELSSLFKAQLTMSLTASATAALITPLLTTTFIPAATTCTENRLTMLANRAFEIWMNEPLPVAGSTFTDCYPSQFATSYLLQAGGATQPAFNPLICPVNYSTVGPYTSNYIACCPRLACCFL